MTEDDILSETREIEIIARGAGAHIQARLNRKYGRGRWRKLKGVAVTATYVWQKFTGLKPTESGAEISSGNAGWRKNEIRQVHRE